jgi:hypothetical protein
MSIYQVWHVNKEDPLIRAAALRHRFKEEDGNQLLFPEHYTHVANVNINDIEDAYELANHIHTAWYNNKSVEILDLSRSTSIGDVIVDKKGVVHRCESMGWEQIKVQEERHDIR